MKKILKPAKSIFRHFPLCHQEQTLGSRSKHYQGIFLLSLLITISPWQTVFPAISHSTDAKGTIHINNDPKAASQDNLDAQASGQPGPAAVVNPQAPTPSNIFPEPEAPVAPAFLTAEPELPPE